MLAEHGATSAVLARLLADADKLHADYIADLQLSEHCPAGPASGGAPDGDWAPGAISSEMFYCLRDALPRVLAGMARDPRPSGEAVDAEAAAVGRACAALLCATPPARQFAPLYLCRILVGSEAFAAAWLDGETFHGDGSWRAGAPETLLEGALAAGSPAAAKSARVLGLTSLANLAGAPHGARLLMHGERSQMWLKLHARAVELVLHDEPDTASAAAALWYNLALELPLPELDDDDGVDELWSNCLALPMRHAQRHARSVYAGSNAAGHRETARRLLLCVGQLLLRGGDEAKGLALSVELPEALHLLRTSALCADEAAFGALVAEVLSLIVD